MNSSTKLIVVLVILVLVGAVFAFMHSRQLVDKNPFRNKHLLKKGQEKPALWLYYDTSDVNSARWYDFGGRSSRALNLPFLNLCYQTAVLQNQQTYRVEVINGLTGLHTLLGLEAMPVRLRNPIQSVNEAELTWIRAAVLAKFGGLWLDPHTICLRPFGKLSKKSTIFFGTDLQETYAGKEGTALPGFRCVWSPTPLSPLFSEWAEIAKARLNAQAGGQQIRRDENWDWVALSKKYPNVQVDFAAECGRKRGGRRLELEDLLATGLDGQLPFAVPSQSVYVPIMWPELRDREMFGWFLRMSEEQIMESDIAVRYLLDRGLTVMQQIDEVEIIAIKTSSP